MPGKRSNTGLGRAGGIGGVRVLFRGPEGRALKSAVWVMALAWGAALAVVADRGFYDPLLPRQVLLGITIGLIAVYWFFLGDPGKGPADAPRRWGERARLSAQTWWSAVHSPRWRLSHHVIDEGESRVTLLDVVLALAVLADAGGYVLGFGPGLALAHVAVLLIAIVEAGRVTTRLSRVMPSPGLLLPISFAVMIVMGTMALKLPVATATPHRVLDGKTVAGLSWVDAGFTATSAVCVTGLAVKDTSEFFTPAGQAIIATLIQLGGLGIVLFGATLAALMGRRLSLRDHLTLRESLETSSLRSLTRYAVFVVTFTLTAELIGAALMFGLWRPESVVGGGELSMSQRLGLSLFHSVSAFCNAGFDITGRSMVGERHGLLAHGVIVPLIIVGGLGFPVLNDLWEAAGAKWRRWRAKQNSGPLMPPALPHEQGRLTLHTKITLLTTLGVYLVGLVGIWLAQTFSADFNGGHVDRAGPLGRLLDASFMSVTARTAGFNSMPMEGLAPLAVTILVALMFVGGSPGSTAGGVKTTTIGVLVVSIFSTIRGRDETETMARTIPESLVRKAGAVTACMLLLVVLSTAVLSLTEAQPLDKIAFECVSAATTTGLSLGITPSLSTPGKVVLIGTMFLGRVGPLGLLGALVFAKPRARDYAFPRENVNLG